MCCVLQHGCTDRGLALIEDYISHLTHLFDYVGAEFLNRQGANITGELANDTVAEPVVVEVEDVLNDLGRVSRGYTEMVRVLT